VRDISRLPTGISVLQPRVPLLHAVILFTYKQLSFLNGIEENIISSIINILYFTYTLTLTVLLLCHR
jgi:hypothetical protein